MALNITDCRVLIGITVFLLIIGGMVLDPVLSLLFFAISGIFALGAIIKSRGKRKIVAFILLILAVVLLFNSFPKSKTHVDEYKKKVGERKM